MSMPKLHVLAFSFALVTVAAALPASAQPPAPPQASVPRAFDVEGRLAELQGRLALDARQVEQVRAILVAARTRMAELQRSHPGPRDEAFRLARRQIVWDVEDRIWALLTCSQKDSFRLYVRERTADRMVERAHRRGAGFGHGPGAGPRGRGPHGGFRR